MMRAGSATIKLNDSRTHNDKSLWNSTVFGIVFFLNATIIEMQQQKNQTAVLQMMYFIKRDN